VLEDALRIESVVAVGSGEGSEHLLAILRKEATLLLEKNRAAAHAGSSSFKVIVRRAAPRDQKRWRELFDGYCLFYKRTPSEALTRHTW
jgi:hypothetical protein